MKTCSKCKYTKPFDMFNSAKNAKDKLKSSCKECERIYRLLNKEHISKREKDYRKNNKERIKKSYLDNRENRLNYLNNWKKFNKEKINKYNIENKEKRKEYRLNNKERYRNYKVKRRKACEDGKLSNGIINSLYIKQHGLCVCCKRKLGDDYHLDHIMPLALGGKNIDENVQLLKSECNLKKRAMHPIDYMQTKGYLL